MAAEKFRAVALVFELPLTHAVCTPPAHVAVEEHIAALNQRVGQVADHDGLKLDAPVKLRIGLLHKGRKAFGGVELLQAAQGEQAVAQAR